MRRRGLGFGWLCLVLSCVQSAAANGLIRDGVGPIPGGRGGTNIAFGDNGAVLLSNPAGMSFMPRQKWIEGGADVLITDLNYSDPLNPGTDNLEAFGLPMIAYMQRVEDTPWSFGIGAFVPAGFGTNWSMNGPAPFTGPQTYKSLGGLVKVLPGVAYQVTPELSVGASLGAAISFADLEGPFHTQTGPQRGLPSLLDMEATGAAPTWSLGLQYQLSERTIVGAVYSSEDRFQLDGSSTVTIPGPGGLIFQSDYTPTADLVWPQSVGVGVQHLLSERHRLGADVIWFDWSHAFDRLDLRMSDPSNPLLQAAQPETRDSLPLDWEDSVSFRFGYEYLLSPADIVRLGYVYNTKVVPNGTLTPFIPATLNQTVTAGYSRVWNGWWFNTAYQYLFGPERHVSGSAIFGGDFDNSTFDAQAHVLMFSLGREF